MRWKTTRMNWLILQRRDRNTGTDKYSDYKHIDRGREREEREREREREKKERDFVSTNCKHIYVFTKPKILWMRKIDSVYS
jgi:hypothetical protein